MSGSASCAFRLPRGGHFSRGESQKKLRNFDSPNSAQMTQVFVPSLPVDESLGKFGVREPDAWQHNEAQRYQEQER